MTNLTGEKNLGSIPLNAAAYWLSRKYFETLPDDMLAGVEFGPWEFTDLCIVPTAKQWRAASPEVPRILKIASGMVRNNKAGLMDATEKFKTEELDDLMKALARWAYAFRMHLAMLEAAQDRMIVTIAALAERDSGQIEA